MNEPASRFIELVDAIQLGKSVHRRAPHKPLLLLLAIADVQKQLPRLRRYREIEDRLATALSLFGRPARIQHPQYPFWRLQNDLLWEVEADGELIPRKSNTDPKRSELVAKRARGGFLHAYHEVLFADPELQSALIHRILDQHFPPSVHEEILAFFGLQVRQRLKSSTWWDTGFRRAVLDAYSNRCAITGFSASAEGHPVGVEAAYILWPQSGGTSEVSNGIALNGLHRKLFDLGLVTVTAKFQVRVSARGRRSAAFHELVGRYDGQEIQVPEDSRYQPSKQSLGWHASEVFRG